MITAIGALLGPLCLWFWRRPDALLKLVLVYSVFSAAAILVIGGFGVMPSLMPVGLFIALFLVNNFNGVHYPAERGAFSLLFPFVLVIIGALCSSILMPRLFAGDVLVWPQKITAFFSRSPLEPNAGNITQDMYLLADAFLVIAAATYLTRPGNLLKNLMDWYFVSGLVASFISIWQFTSNMLHIPYPADFFLSNPGWAQLSDQTMGWVVRLNGPFSEPAALAGYMCGSLSASGWVILHGDRRLLPRVTFGAALVVVFLTTASTGYITLAVLVLLALLQAMLAANAALRFRLAAGLVVALAFGGATAIWLPTAAPGMAKQAQVMLDATLDKKNSTSYQERSTADLDSLQEMKETYGLGVGWGSNRSSSLLPGLCAAIGIWGIAGLVWFGASLTLQASRVMRFTEDPTLRYTIHGTAAALTSNLVSALLSGPTISSPDFYLLLAMLVAATARAQRDAVPLRRRQAATSHRAKRMGV